MDPMLVVSPHLDDAALSIGQLIAGRDEVTVVTVMAGLPPEPVSTSFDQNSHFRNSTEALTRRRDEDKAAMKALRASPIHLDIVDGQYGGVQSREATAAGITAILELIGAKQLVIPVGIMHPDHLFVSEAALDVAQASGVETWVYEELPNRVVNPESVPEGLDRARRRGYTPELGFLGTGPVDMKQKAVRCYRSQLWALDFRCLYVPERVWRLWPSA